MNPSLPSAPPPPLGNPFHCTILPITPWFADFVLHVYFENDGEERKHNASLMKRHMFLGSFRELPNQPGTWDFNPYCCKEPLPAPILRQAALIMQDRVLRPGARVLFRITASNEAAPLPLPPSVAT